ncbi:DUF4232 domain-containing protein [Streptomyces clavuligerus]|uniref:DUF4232 domain-containing protein n=3 Tax=Streptomyces clavuligerus TaxID=1901 RepID=D5SJQ1_STRCL|nr:DUF4232 domain-containing protein [Streptomyces clavuligerus]EFG04144.1 Hypothetical protein SCLAV_p0657 [Streptomyces clavuligerus]MBY6307374.1 DUF4232 domain-containing protein [Streptomyces clavuligerus]QCS10063.1 DUF4232 domain-containing protein [Streptomyces clavuligerus]QPJ97893.1 DUF4232 domain-containing protein [Streptomyces clavuligerus]WDN56768.1 DUF4232 domain-containing protein [Streptomyces clavuligerus]
MPLRRRNRSGRLVLTAVAAVSLSLAVTGCSSAKDDNGDSKSDASEASIGASPDGRAATGSGEETATATADGGATAPASATGVDGGVTPTSTATTGSPEKARAGRLCTTNDLNFTVGVETQAGGYYLITAKAKPGITCYLEGKPAAVAFGSALDSHATPAEQAVSATVKLSGATRAYAGVNPKTTNDNHGTQYEYLIVSAAHEDPDPISLKLPDTALVAKPVATNWHADRADAVPF